MKNLKQLKAKRIETTNLMSGLVSETRNQNGMVEEDQVKFNAAKEEVRAIDKQMANLEELRSLTETAAIEIKPNNDDSEFRSFLRSEQRAANSTLTNAGGAFLVGGNVENQLIVAIKSASGMIESATVKTTGTGAEMSWPTMDDLDASDDAVIKAQTDARRNNDAFVFGSISLKAFTLDSGISTVSNEMVQDSVVNIETEVINALANRVGRKLNKLFTFGNGTNEPAGIVTQALLGKTAASATLISSDEILDLQFTVDEVYAANGKYMMNSSTLAAISKLKDGNGNYLLTSAINGTTRMLFGKPIVINNDMDSIAATKSPIIFGDLSKYFVRTVQGINAFKFNEKYQDTNCVGYKISARFDGCLLVPAAVKTLTMKA